MKGRYLLYNIAMVILAWLTLPVLGLSNIKRFLGSSILITLLEGIHAQFGKKRKWWIFYNKPYSFLAGEFPFIVGPFLVGSMWILKWTYGNFKRFILLNAIVDGSFAFLLTSLYKKVKIFKLGHLDKTQFFLYFFHKAFLLYGFQYLLENRKSLLGKIRTPFQ